MQANDFFIPYDAEHLDTIDGDLGSGAPVLLPPAQFDTPSHPHLAVEIGKEGRYGVDGNPSFAQVGQSSDSFAYGSSLPVVTSTDTATGCTSSARWLRLVLRRSVPVALAPTSEGEQGAQVTASVDATTYSAGVNGAAVSASAELTVTPRALSFGGSPPGQPVTSGVNVANTGSPPLTIQSIGQPAAPFSTSSLPAPGTVIQPGQVLAGNVTLSPNSYGEYENTLRVDAGEAGVDSVPLSGSSASPGKLIVSPTLLRFPRSPVGSTQTMGFTVINSGGTRVTITESQVPVANAFRAVTSLQEGTSIAPGKSLTETVSFAPVSAGTFHDKWVVNSTGSGVAAQVQLSGVGYRSSTDRAALYALMSFTAH